MQSLLVLVTDHTADVRKETSFYILKNENVKMYLERYVTSYVLLGLKHSEKEKKQNTEPKQNLI